MSSKMEWIELKELSEKVRIHLQELKTFLSGNDKGQQEDAGIDDITKFAINQILYPEGDRHVETEIVRREKTLKDGGLRILIAGEQATGKSSLMNILMGGDYLPTDHFHCTAVLCELHLSSERKACFFFRDKGREPIEINDLDNANKNTKPNINGTGWERVWYYVKESPDTRDILKVKIFWPIPFIKHLLALRPTSEAHKSLSRTRQDHDCDMSRDLATRMRELKLPDIRYPGDDESRTGSVIEENKEIQAYCKTTNAFFAESSTIRCSDGENVQSKARRPLITERFSHIEAQSDTKSEKSDDIPISPSSSQLPTGTIPPIAHLQQQEILEENESKVNSPAQGQGDNNDPTSEETQPEEYYQSIYQLPSGMTPQFEPDTVVAVQDLPGEDDLTNSVESSQYPDRASSTLVCCDEFPEAINVVFCDCPEIPEYDEYSFQTTLDNVETAHGIILLTDAFKINVGIEQNKVIPLLQRIQNKLRWLGTTLQYKPLLYVCNKMDMIKDLTTRQTFKEKVHQLVADNFPTTQNISVRFLGKGEIFDDQPHSTDLFDLLGSYLKQSLTSALEEQYL